MQRRFERKLIRACLPFFLLIACVAPAAQTGPVVQVDSVLTWRHPAPWFGGFSGVEVNADGTRLTAVSDRGRDGITGKRERGHIGFSAIRGGDIVGEHDVMFAAAGERVILRHIATDRAVFARGALKAALWGQGRKPGEYDMLDVLGLGDG